MKRTLNIVDEIPEMKCRSIMRRETIKKKLNTVDVTKV